MNSTHIPDRDLRQRDIIPPDRLAASSATVIGVGAIGRQVALQLAAMGIPSLQLIDPDIVEPVNLGCQGYLQEDLGRSKVEATADLCRRIHHGLEVRTHRDRFLRSMPVGQVVFCCVDSIDTRRHIWQALGHAGRPCEFFCDGRMAAEVLRILTVCDPASRRHYPSTLFPAAEAYAGACTARSTIFCAGIAAGLMLSQFARFLRRLPVDPDLQLNLLAGELSAMTT